jgi:hypothetical protein
MKKYRIGLIVIALLVVSLAGYTLYLGQKGKQDLKTEEKANEVAEKLNIYVNKNGEIPESIDEIGVSNIPSTIKYEKLTDETYEFCVTYQNEKGYGSGYGYSPMSLLTGSLYGAAYSMSDTEDSDYERSYLYLDYTHKKGENCQTIRPYGVSTDYSNDGFGDNDYGSEDTSDTYYDLSDTEYCQPGHTYYSYYKEAGYCN